MPLAFSGPTQPRPRSSMPNRPARSPPSPSIPSIRLSRRSREFPARCRRPARHGLNGCAVSAPSFGGPMICLCSRFLLRDNTSAVLVRASFAGLDLALSERARRLLADADRPAAIFSGIGELIDCAPAARERLGAARNLLALGAEKLMKEASIYGYAEGEIDAGHVVLYRLGAGTTVALLVAFDDAAIQPAEIAEAPAAEPVEEISSPPRPCHQRRVPPSPAPSQSPPPALPPTAELRRAKCHPAGRDCRSAGGRTRGGDFIAAAGRAINGGGGDFIAAAGRAINGGSTLSSGEQDAIQPAEIAEAPAAEPVEEISSPPAVPSTARWRRFHRRRR